MSSLGKNISKEMKKKGLSVLDLVSFLESNGVLASHSGKPYGSSSIYSLLNGTRPIPASLIPYMSEFVGVPEQDLFDPSKRKEIAKSEILNNKDEYLPLFPEIQLKENMLSMPIAYTGAGAEAIIDSAMIEKIHIEKKLLSRDALLKINENTMAFKIIGDSMTPSFNENDIIFVDMINNRSVRLGDGIWLIRIGGTVQIKQIQFIKGNEANIISINKNYPILNTSRDNIDWEIIGKPFMRWGVEYFNGLELEG